MRALVVVMLLAGVAHADDWVFPDPEPSAQETLLLEYVNRFRADPPAEARRVQANPGAQAKDRHVDWMAFQKEVDAEPPAPPLVMNMKLLLAARRHARYLALNDKKGHEEENALAGFTGQKMAERARQAGYDWIAWWENVFAARDPWSVHAGFVIDLAGDQPNGMREGRGHRKTMLRTNVREAGMAAFARDHDAIYTEAYGDRKDAPRLAGGVVYVDRDKDHFYSVGEGVGGVKITASDGTSATTWKSGGYALQLKGTGAVTLTVIFQGRMVQKDFPAGADNIKLDWIVPVPNVVKGP